MIKYHDVTFSYADKVVIKNFSATLDRGEHVALMGESGAGKSTLLQSLMGLTLPDSGEIWVEKQLLTPVSVHEIRSKVAWIPQDIQLPYVTVKQALEDPYRLKVNHHKKLDCECLFSHLEELNLNRSIYDKKMAQLSGGERQRLMILSAIMLNKQVLLLDEPTSALDPKTRRLLIEFLARLDITLLSVTHDLEFAQSCGRTIMLQPYKD